MHLHDFHVKKSIYLKFIYGLFFVASFVVINLIQVHSILKLLIVSSVLIYGFFIWQLITQQSKHSILSFHLQPDGKWIIQTRSQLYHAAEMLSDSIVTATIMILKFRLPGQYWTRSCVLLPDSLTATAFRHLLVRLRNQ
jgi:toxin CptA